MIQKYVEELFPSYFILGESHDGRFVDVTDGEGDIVIGIPRRTAQRLIADRERVVEALSAAMEMLTDEQCLALWQQWHAQRKIWKSWPFKQEELTAAQ